jgi:hypothetical protein
VQKHRFDGECRARHEAATAAGHVQRFDLGVPAARRAAELERGGALPRNHERMVERRHESRAALRGELAGDRLAILALAIVEHHFRTPRTSPVDLHLWGIGGHHDGCGNTEPMGCQRDGLSVIAR